MKERVKEDQPGWTVLTSSEAKRVMESIKTTNLSSLLQYEVLSSRVSIQLSS